MSKTAKNTKIYDEKTPAEKRVSVVFHSQEGPGGDDDIFVAVNGRAYLIKREREVSLPAEVLGVLKNARQTLFEQHGGRVIPRDVQRYGYSVAGSHAG